MKYGRKLWKCGRVRVVIPSVEIRQLKCLYFGIENVGWYWGHTWGRQVDSVSWRECDNWSLWPFLFYGWGHFDNLQPVIYSILLLVRDRIFIKGPLPQRSLGAVAFRGFSSFNVCLSVCCHVFYSFFMAIFRIIPGQEIFFWVIFKCYKKDLNL